VVVKRITVQGDNTLTKGAITNCPKCQSSKKIICLAGGIVLTQTQQMPLYCLSCNLSFLAIKKNEPKNESQYLSFEVLSEDQRLSPQLSSQMSNNSKRLEAKR
jgi:transcription elongation factor Elf1